MAGTEHAPVSEPEADAGAPRSAALPGAPALGSLAPETFTPAKVLALQRAAGNAAVVAALKRAPGRLVPVAQAATKLREARAAHPARPDQPGVRHRLPAPDELKKIYSGGMVPQQVVEDAVRRALRRMDADWDLRTDSDDVMKKLFPKSGVFDETAWAGVLGTDTGDVYKSAADAETKVKPADLVKLSEAATAAADEIDKAMADDAGLKEVFGKQAKTAKARYGKAKKALRKAIANADKAIDTDYNRDDPQVGLGGWANFYSQHMHLTGDVAEVTNRKATIITLIHEACHLAHPDVDDHGYYGSEGFEAMSERQKVNNAAHYEELPARSLGVSHYANRDAQGKITSFKTFTPGKTASGKTVTFEQHVRRDASEYLRKAWDAAVDVHSLVRSVAKKMAADPKSKSFANNSWRLLEISKVEHLTIHQQKPRPKTVTLLDVVLSEGVAHATTRIQENAEDQSVPASGNRKAAVKAVIAGSIADYGELLGDAAADRKLMDWLVAHYRNV